MNTDQQQALLYCEELPDDKVLIEMTVFEDSIDEMTQHLYTAEYTMYTESQKKQHMDEIAKLNMCLKFLRCRYSGLDPLSSEYAIESNENSSNEATMDEEEEMDESEYLYAPPTPPQPSKGYSEMDVLSEMVHNINVS
jgi:hypothetical protein